jgi:Kef-type K+ transport system membrane component KefB
MFADASLLKRMGEVSVEDLLLPLLIQLALIVVAARAFAWLFRRLGQPAVVGEIAAGLVLGPSVLGRLAPGLFAAVFRPALAGLPPEAADLLLSRVLTALAQLGLVLLLFLVGLEFDFSHLRRQGRSALAISVSGIVVPFGLGAALGWASHAAVAADIPRAGYVLFMGTALSITAIPVLGRMMLEWGVTRTRLAAVTISAAAADDASGWVLLAAVAAAARADFDPWHTAGMMAATVAFGLFMLLAARPLLSRFARLLLRAGGGELGVNGLAAVLVLVFLAGVATNLIGIFAVFGAFALGAVLSGEEEFREAVNRKLRDVVTSFLLPIYFAYTGLRTDVGALGSRELWGLAALVSLAAVLGKFGGCAVAAWLGGLRPREAACVGAMMNTRGLMELVVVNVGKDLGVIPDSVFCALVLMALVTTFMTTPLLVWLARGTELEAAMVASGFLGPRPEAGPPGEQSAG